jgi:hypothetical protein
MEQVGMHSKPHNSLYDAGMVKRLLLGMEAFRKGLAARLDAVEPKQGAEHTVVARRGQPIAVLVPIEWYREAADKLGDPTEF